MHQKTTPILSCSVIRSEPPEADEASGGSKLNSAGGEMTHRIVIVIIKVSVLEDGSLELSIKIK